MSMKISEFLKKLFGCKKEEVLPQVTVDAPQNFCSNPECEASSNPAAAEPAIKKSKKKRGRPRKKKKEE